MNFIVMQVDADAFIDILLKNTDYRLKYWLHKNNKIQIIIEKCPLTNHKGIKQKRKFQYKKKTWPMNV